MNILHTKLSEINTANTLLSDNLYNKFNELTTTISILTALINAKFGAPNHTTPEPSGIHHMKITHTHIPMNALALPPSTYITIPTPSYNMNIVITGGGMTE